MIPPKRFDEDDDQKDRTPPPLLMFTELGHTPRDWIVTYHFFLGPLDGHFAMYLGRRDDLDGAAVKEKAFAPKSPQLGQARLALLQAITLETMN